MGRAWTVVLLLAVAAAGGLTYYWWPAGLQPAASPTVPLPFERLTNTVFTPEPADPLVPPEVRLVRMPEFPGNSVIWGATGRDDTGHVWLGVSTHDVPVPSAHLMEYDPTLDVVTDRGNVLDELGRLGLLRPGEVQPKIHTRIVQAGDGHLYFASMNETADEGGPRAPPFGSHLWRLRLPERQWEHLAATAEGLIAVAGGGDYVYALGYPDHRLVQFHVPTARVRAVTVGSYGGHISRNLLADARGHAYVPRLQGGTGGRVDVSLVEYDTDLHELAASPLPHYLDGPPDRSHGIIAFQHLPDRTICFATHVGRLYRLMTDMGRGPALLSDLGWFHPKGRAYTPSLFTYSGATLVGIGRRIFDGEDRDVWLRYDLRLRIPSAMRLTLPGPDGRPINYSVLLYGNQTRDRYGDCYLVGATNNGRWRPLVFRVRPGTPAKTDDAGPVGP
ncbi:MAG TPA: hypothetical protein VGF55_26820 [Gemmataceae bacterium]|jgi:hypothetical protein